MNIIEHILTKIDVSKLFHLINNSKWNNFFYYFVIAGFCSLIDLILLYILTEFLGILYLLSATISFIVVQILNYYVNKTFNFKNKSKHVSRQFSLFILINTVGLALSLGILALLVEVFGLWYILGRIISMLFAFNFNFFLHNRYTFARVKSN